MTQEYREISKWLEKLPETFGVYKFFDENKKLVYVGKAINLKRRVNQYFVKNPKSNKVLAMAKTITYIDFIITKNEAEALLLENNIIFNNKPVFNIKLKNKKIYPFIVIDKSLGFARVYVSWSLKTKGLMKFGPFVSKHAALELVDFIQNVLLMRSCLDKVFNNRSRPCILYEIGKCSAPCVNYTDNQNYTKRTQQAIDFLSGKTNSLREFCVKEMHKNSQLKNYELAAFYRDKIKYIEVLNKPQSIVAEKGDYDVYMAECLQNNVCVNVILIRNGQVLDQHNIILSAPLNQDVANCILQILFDSFINCKLSPIQNVKNIIVSHINQEFLLLEEMLYTKLNQKIKITDKIPSEIKKIIELSILNAKTTLKLNIQHKLQSLYDEISIRKGLGLIQVPENVECFDISHFQGDCSVASCVVFSNKGPDKKLYRSYNIKTDTPGDDYQAIYQVVFKRYKNHNIPSIILIDGGFGQLKAAKAALDDLAIFEVAILAVSKGKGRIVGQEKLNFISGECVQLENTNKALHCIQAIRDEAHRYAIKNHRKKLQKKSLSSTVITIPGVGEKKKQLLLNHFIELKALQNASENELMIPGISKKLAKSIYDFFH